ncbi:hypothetical protein [Luteimonas sp. MC1750]|uniref:hypothetical protein n=1 Tax=Luteimonas sp. MC1750 TaxID=2799326 RepID=UPI0018F05C05|nr:hypothetical protein [Luteimonas sp. MC1750]MBJ6984029.1 hypothetical protein [Luteimonas sp. MC1750]QQO06841.1 hypothetical protein JGR68_05285 [Luteimonas sp. MC1750]
MITETYFDPISQAIDTLELGKVKAALASARKHCALTLKQDGVLTGQEMAVPSCVKLATHSVIESRDENDLTLLMYACLLYRAKAIAGDRMACRALDQIIGWLVEEGATVWAQGRRSMVRAGTHKGRPMYVRGEGTNIIQALGQRNLPPSVQKYISETHSETYDWYEQRVRA